MVRIEEIHQRLLALIHRRLIPLPCGLFLGPLEEEPKQWFLVEQGLACRRRLGRRHRAVAVRVGPEEEAAGQQVAGVDRLLLGDEVVIVGVGHLEEHLADILEVRHAVDRPRDVLAFVISTGAAGQQHPEQPGSHQDLHNLFARHVPVPPSPVPVIPITSRPGHEPPPRHVATQPSRRFHHTSPNLSAIPVPTVCLVRDLPVSWPVGSRISVPSKGDAGREH